MVYTSSPQVVDSKESMTWQRDTWRKGTLSVVARKLRKKRRAGEGDHPPKRDIFQPHFSF